MVYVGCRVGVAGDGAATGGGVGLRVAIRVGASVGGHMLRLRLAST